MRGADNSKYTAVVPGSAILGAAAAIAAQQTAYGGAIVPGTAVMNPPAPARVKPRRPVAADRAARAVPAPAADLATLTEDAVAVTLEAHPEQWERVLEAELKRPDGLRTDVLRSLLGAADRVDDFPADVRAMLTAHVASADVTDEGLEPLEDED